MGKGQVALYVLLGVVLLLSVVIAIHVVTVKSKVSASSRVDEGSVVTNSLEAAKISEEKIRITKRMNHCLEEMGVATIQRLLLQEGMTLDGFQREVAQEIVEQFNQCQSILGVEGHITSSTEQANAVVEITDVGVQVTITQPLKLKDVHGQVSKFQTLITGPFQRLFSLSDEIEQGTLPMFDKHCSLDLYAFADKGIYSDLFVSADGEQFLELRAESDGHEYRKVVRLPQCEVKQ